MGFRSATYDVKKLSDQLGIGQDKVYSAMKASRIGGFARLWAIVEDNGKFAKCRISVSSRKDANSPYETQFQDGYTSFVGPAYEKVKQLDITEKGVPIVILNCDTRTKYDGNTKKMYTNYAVYEFDVLESSGSASTSNAHPKAASTKKPPEVKGDVYIDEDELPF